MIISTLDVMHFLTSSVRIYAALVSMEYLKAQVQESPLIPDVAKSAAFLDACNLLKCDNHEGVLSIEDLSKNLGIDFQKVMRRYDFLLT